MSVLLWCNGIALILLIGESCNANLDCKIISSCEMVCLAKGPWYDCYRRELLAVPIFPETTAFLDLSYNAIKTLYSDTFEYYLNLFNLDLSNNYLTSLPASVFSNNVALQFLLLSNNNLTSLPDTLFKYNVGLMNLGLDGNSLTTLPLNLFSSNVGLLDLLLSNNNLTSLPDTIFKNNVALMDLGLDENSLTTLPLNLFSSNVGLLHVLLSHNNLTSLPDTIFKYNVGLMNLDLDGNSLTTLPLNLFSSNVGLVHLSLEFNYIDSLPQNIFDNNLDLQMLFITGNPIDNIDTRLFDNHNDIGNLLVFCSKCFDCDCLSVSTYEWITKRVTDLSFYEFSCRNGVGLSNIVVNCSDDGSRLAVVMMPNESSCNCKKSIAMKASSTDTTTVATPALESTVDKVQHKMKTKGSSYTYIGVIISGMAASITLITSFTALRRFINTASRIRHSDLTDTEHNISSNDGIDVIRALNCSGQTDKEYNNIPPKSHMNTSNDGMNVIRALNCNGQMNNEYNNIPPKSHMNTSNDGMYVIRALNCNGQMDKEYNNIPPKSHMTLSSFSNIPYTHHLMVFERNSTSGKSDITFVEASEL